MCIWLVLFLMITVRAQAAPMAPALPMGLEGGTVARVFATHENFTWMAEASAINETDARDYREVTLGGYDLILPWLKSGLFFRRAYGLRHDADWSKEAGYWEWDDTNSRAEDFAVADISPRWQLDENWLFEFKTRYLYNSFNGEQSVMLRPALTYFWLREQQPFLNFFFQLEEDVPLNYGHRKIDEQWVYAGSLYHLTRCVDLGSFVAWSWQTWQSSASYLEKGGAPYSVTAQATVVSLLAIFNFPY